jgi:hypothetical protein
MGIGIKTGDLFGALYKFNKSSNSFEFFDAGLSDLFTINEDSNGDLWGGNLNQLVKD